MKFEVTADSYGSLLASVLLKKIPQDLCLIMTRKAPGSEWKLDSLLEMMEEELIARERTALSSTQQPPRRGPDKPPHTVTTLMSGNSPSSPSVLLLSASPLFDNLPDRGPSRGTETNTPKAW